MPTKKAIVVGGGFAGLTSGYVLAKAGWDVTLLEAAEEVGGRVRTVRQQGYTLDVGATQMAVSYREYLTLCEELGLRDQMVRSSQKVGILKNGRIYVIDASNALSAILSPVLSLRSKLKLLNAVKDASGIKPPLDVLDVSRSHALDVESATDYARRRLNPELFDVVVDPLIRTYVMTGPDQISALELFSALKNLAGQTLLGLLGGNDRLPKALAHSMDVRLNTAATAVSQTDTGVEVTCTSPSGSQRLTAEACVLATRLHEAMAIYPKAKQIAGGFGERIRYCRAWVVKLGYRIRPNTDVVGVILPTKEQAEVGLLWLEHNKTPDRAPAGHSLFTVYSDDTAIDAYYEGSDDDLVRLATQFVERLFPELRGQQDLHHVTRWPCAIPITAPGMYKEMFAMKERLDPKDPVQLAGDYLTCTGQNSAIYYGKIAAENIIAHQANPAAVNGPAVRDATAGRSALHEIERR